MGLIKTIAEMRAVIPKLSKFSDTSELPNMDKAGRMHILPIIGKQLYDDLNAAYTEGTATAEQTELIKEIQLPLAAFALLDDLSFIHTSITDNGIRTAQTANFQAAHRWEYLELQNALINYATDGIELLLSWLYENKAAWAQWTSSEAYKDIDGLLIKTGFDFKNYYPLFQPLRTYWALRPIIRNVEENYMARTIGRELFQWIKSQDEIVVTDDGEEVDVLRLLKISLANLSITHAGEQLAVRFDQNGFTVLAMGGSLDNNSSDGRQHASFTDMRTKIDAANREGQNFLYKAAKYLVGIADGLYGSDWGDDFATAFTNSPLKTDPEKPQYTNGNERRKIFRMP